VEATDFSDYLRDYADCRQPEPKISFIETNKTRQDGHEEDINLWSVILKRRDNLGNPDLDGFVILRFVFKKNCYGVPYRIYVPENRVQGRNPVSTKLIRIRTSEGFF